MSTNTLIRLGTLGFGAFAMITNLAPMSTPVVPLLSQLTPVYAEVTQFGNSQHKFVSHQEFVFMNETRENALEEIDKIVEDFEREIDEAFSPDNFRF